MSIKIGIIGTRHVHAEGLARIAQRLGATVIGAAERDTAAAATWTGLGICDLMSSEQVIDSADAVIVAGTNAERVEDTLQVVAAGLPVLSEKPLAITAETTQQVAREAAGSAFMTALPIRFSAALQRARVAITSGAIGTPLAGRGTNHGVYPGGWFGVMAEAGGGAIADHTVHISDGLCWLLDDRITRVYTAASDRMHPSLDVDSVGVLTFDFASGFFASLDTSWSRPESFHTWGDVWMEVVGTEGRLVIDAMARTLGIYDDRAGKLRTVGYDTSGMTSGMLEAFISYAQDGGPSPVSLDEGLHATDVVLAAYASAASGDVAEVPNRAAIPA
jgi:predicted dehydrogenase